MKLLIPVLLLLVSATAMSQKTDSIVAPYLQDKKLPFFKVTLTDSSSFYTSDLKRKQPVMVILFSPDCEHCKKLTHMLLEKISAFKKTQIVMVSPLPLSRIREFYTEMKISDHPTITMGKDALYFFVNYFQTHSFPFIALYNKKQELLKGWESNVTIDELLETLK